MQDIMFDSLVTQTHYQILQSILFKREKSNGNYDAFYGKISNYSWDFNDGVYSISLKLVSLGDVIESLNMNYLSPNLKIQDNSDNSELNEEEKSIQTERDKNDIARLFYYAKKSRTFLTEQEQIAQNLLGASFQNADQFVEQSKESPYYAATVGTRGLK